MRGAARVSLACLLVAGFAAGGVVAGASSAAATVASGNATAIAQALASSSGDVTSASFVATPPSGTPDGTSDGPLTGFPTDGSSFGILTTGNVNSVPHPGTFADTSDGGGNVRGASDYDVSILKVNVDVPSGSNCLGFDFKFLSEEYPRFVGTQYNDAFIAELDTSNWTTSGSAITAPNDFALDGSGNVVSVNSTGIGGMHPADGTGTAFDGSGSNHDGAATGVLHAFHQVTPGAHSIYFSIFDQGDHDLDSAAFLDNLRIGFVANPSVNCVPGATPVTYSLDLEPPTASIPVGTQDTLTATLTDQDGNPVTGAPVGFTVSGVNSGSGTGTTDSRGVATFSYTGTNVGSDQISACYDADNTPPCEAVASASADWTPAAGLDVESSSSPNPVTEGDNVVDSVTITGTGATNHNVAADVSSDLGGTVLSATPSQGSCDPPSGTDVSCALGDLDAGSSATIQVVVQVPKPGPDSGQFDVTTVATSDEVPPPGESSVASAAVSSASAGSVSGYVPPDGTIALGPTTPSPSNPTVATFSLPDSGPGAEMTLDTLVAPPGFCGTVACQGPLLELTDFSGYTDPNHPAVLVVRLDKHVVHHGLRLKLYLQKSPTGPITLIPPCTSSGVADPAPCVDAKHRAHGYTEVRILLLSGDPKIGFR